MLSHEPIDNILGDYIKWLLLFHCINIILKPKLLLNYFSCSRERKLKKWRKRKNKSTFLLG